MTREQSDAGSEQCVVEDALGPVSGYYHNLENGTVAGDEVMSRSRAESLGYSRCRTCFPEEIGDE